MKFRKLIQTLIYYLLPLVLVYLSFTLNNRKLYSKLGNIAFVTLAANLYLRPIFVIFRNKLLNWLNTYRRELGIASFWFYIFHAVGFFLLYNIPLERFLDTSTYSFWAFLASIGMILLTITSNDYSIKLLKRWWKRLHRFAYPLFFFALIHVSLAQNNPKKILIVGAPYIILKIFEYKKIPFKW